MARITRIVRRASQYVLHGALYWLGSGIARRPRPRAPRRYGHGPYKTTRRYALDLAFYPVLLTAWLVGAAGRPVWCVLRGEMAESHLADPAPQWEGVRHLPVLGQDECAAIAERVHELRDLWLPRQPGFFTLGRAAYMDCRNPVSRLHYIEDAPRLNEALLHYFAPLYQRIAETLQQALDAPCRLADRQAIPGFHVWLGEGIPRLGFDVASVHFDLQYLDVGLVTQDLPRAVEVVSFTLPIRLPRAGGGLNVWDIRHAEPAGGQVWPFTQMSRVQYKLGSLVLHTGHELHQIAPVERIVDGDQRICLQGHGIRQGEGWLLYW